MKTFRAELHVHTVLSPCAEIEMIPPFIVSEALDKGINLIAITDHNATANIAAVQKAALGTELTVLPGMELQTREEVHVLCLFDTIEQADSFQKLIDTRMPDVKNRPDFFGEQFVVDEQGEFVRREERLLLTSVGVSMNEAWDLVSQFGGLFIPAHVNRKVNGLIENLGLVPADLPIEALEISRHLTPDQAIQQFPQISGFPLIQSGDVHRLDDFLGVTYFEMECVSIREIRQAFKGIEGRKMRIKPQ